MDTSKRSLAQVRTLVVKIGSSSLAYANGRPNYRQLEKLVRQMADLYNQGLRLVLVSSGSIGIGAARLRLSERPKNLPQKQATAAVGQGMLMQIYEKLFAEYDITVGQVLLTRDDFSARSRFLNARNTLNALLDYGVLPIINENDTIAVEEIKLGDNDNLSAQVASLIEADLLVILSDVDGLYDANPRLNVQARLLQQVDAITPEIEALADGTGSSLGTGGMHTKLQAAKIAVNSGVAMVIAAAEAEDVLERVVAGEIVGTYFCPVTDKLVNRKRWIAFSAGVQGSITVDDGAVRAIRDKGKSLLPSGITALKGHFAIGAPVSIVDKEGRELARGLVNYRSEELQKIIGVHCCDIAGILGYKDYDEVVHRDNLVIEP